MKNYMNSAEFNVVRKKLSEQIADQLEKTIVTGQYQDNDKLPSEQELAQKFNVSRNVIREAMKILKERGLVKVKNGSGAFVTHPNATNLTNLIERVIVIDNIDANQVYFVRILLETANCEQAACRITSDELDGLRAIATRLENRRLTLAERRELDYSFHIAIAKASGNELLLLLTQSIKSICQNAMFLPEDVEARNSIDESIAYHGKILAALEDHNPEDASKWMRRHLETALNNINMTLEHKKIIES